MSNLKGIAIGCGALAAMVTLAFAALWGFAQSKKLKYDKEAIPFIEFFLADLAHWDPEQVAPYWAPEVAAQLELEKVSRLFLAYRQLGALKSFDPPALLQVGAHTRVPYPVLVTYQVSAQYEAGPAVLTIQLVKTRTGGLKIWFFNVNSEVFLPQLPNTVDASALGRRRCTSRRRALGMADRLMRPIAGWP